MAGKAGIVGKLASITRRVRGPNQSKPIIPHGGGKVRGGNLCGKSELSTTLNQNEQKIKRATQRLSCRFRAWITSLFALTVHLLRWSSGVRT